MDSIHFRYLIYCWVGITAALAAVLAYRNTLSAREDDQLFLNKAERVMMGSEQRVLISKMRHLKPLITVLTVLSGTLLLIMYAIWTWSIFQGNQE